ncbi:MAG TPA: response regulator transcription factor [Desulfuromonadaceae bacterium]
MAEKCNNILAVDDEPKILEVLVSYFESKGFSVFPAASGRQAFEIFDRENISLVILDLMLPDVSGEEICRTIRKKSRVPIIMLTAKVEENDMLQGLQIGADDYITKPFSLKVLQARVEAVLRRSWDDLIPLARKNSFRGGDLIVDFDKNIIRKMQVEVLLTPSEMKILSALVKYPGKVFTRAELIEIALGSEFDGYERAVDNHIKNLRQKIEDDSKNPCYVLTIHGLGYKFGG